MLGLMLPPPSAENRRRAPSVENRRRAPLQHGAGADQQRNLYLEGRMDKPEDTSTRLPVGMAGCIEVNRR